MPLILTLTLSLLAGHIAGSQIAQAQGKYLAAVAARVADHVDQSLAERWLDIQNLSRNRRLTRQPGIVRAELESLRQSYQEFAWIGVTNADGTVIVATDELLEGLDVAARPWFIHAKAAAYVGDLHGAKLLQGRIDNPHAEPLRFVDISAPLHNARGEFQGVLGAHLFAGWISKVLREFHARLNDPLPIDIIILNGAQEVIFGASDSIGDTIRPDLPPPDLQRTQIGYLTESVINDSEGFTGYAYSQAIGDFPGLDWTILVHAPLVDILRPARTIQIQLLASGLLIGLAFVGLGIYRVQRISGPIKALSQRVANARNISDLSSIPPESSFLEMAELTTTLKKMALRLRAGENELARHRAAQERQNAEIRKLETTANTDQLTGILNRRAFEKILPAAIRSASEASPVAISILDLDHFKAINDQYGHAVGDEVLVAVTEAISTCVRGTDSFVRLGGEEFALIFPDTSSTIAVELIERIRKKVLSIEVIANTYAVIVSASFGLVMATSPDEDPKELLLNADKALYAAKAAGRNCVRVSVPVQTPGCAPN